MRLAVEWKFQQPQTHWKTAWMAKEIVQNVHVQLHLVWPSVEISWTERMKSGCRWRADRDVKMGSFKRERSFLPQQNGNSQLWALKLTWSVLLLGF